MTFGEKSIVINGRTGRGMTDDDLSQPTKEEAERRAAADADGAKGESIAA
jgi:hypothetical protein